MRVSVIKVLILAWLITLPVRAANDEIATTFSYADRAAKTVEVAGEFSDWKTIALTKDSAGNWSKTLTLKPGVYGYKLIINGEWKFDPKNPARKTVNDIENSAITVGNASPAPASNTVGTTFSFTDARAKSVHVAGEFNRWLDNVNGRVSGKNEWLMLGDGSGNWKFTTTLSPGRYQFKYVIDGGDRWATDPALPTSADGNSVIEVKSASDPSPASPTLAAVAGNLSFAFAGPAAKAVFVAGEFNNWSPTATPMVKDATGMWTVALTVKPGRYQYKFIVDGTWELDPSGADTAADAAGNKNSVKTVSP